MSSAVPPRADWASVRGLFEAALAAPAGEREALLADPAHDAAVVAEVRSLLAHADVESHESGEGAGDRFLRPVLEADRSGQRLGPWAITRRLGSGGMGDVWCAERADGAYIGQAAIKVLKRGMDSAAVLARFGQERQALARLQHPHIAYLIDAGCTADGLPYFVMEFVAGRSIDEACQGLSLEARLTLFLQLADAVAYAHRNLLVHRDLKPGNVLVDAEGRVKLLDFGIAKALAPEPDLTDGATQHGLRPFTPQYASPEQVRGEPVSTATDIYSLGVLLYVMLTGQRPYGRTAASPADAARAVIEEAPTRPSSLQAPDAAGVQTRRRLQGDLDNILLKALEKPVARRYTSVDALAADVRAFLGGYPVSARPAGWTYRAGKFVARNRAGVAAAALAVLALVGGSALALWQAREAEAQRRVAQQRFEEVRLLAKQLVFKYHDQIVNLPGAVGVRQTLLDDATSFLDSLAAQSAGDAALRRELAETYFRVSLLQGEAFSPSQERVLAALASAEKATSLVEGGVAGADAAQLNTVVDMWLNRGSIEARLGRMARSVESLQRATALAERARLQAPDDLQVISRLATLQGRTALALGANVSQASLGRVAEARPHWDEAVRLFEQLVQREPARAEWAHQLAWGWVGLTNWALLAGRFDEAVTAGRRAVELRDRAAALKPGDAHLAHQRALARNNLATALSLAGNHAGALQLQDEALRMVARTVADDSSNKAAQRDGVLIGLSRARPLAGLKRTHEAMAAVNAALEALPAAAVLPDDFYLARWRAEALVWAARLQRDVEPAQAATAAREAVAQLHALAGEDHAARRWALAQAQAELGHALRATGDTRAAAEAAREALRLWGPQPPGYFTALRQQAAELAGAAT